MDQSDAAPLGAPDRAGQVQRTRRGCGAWQDETSEHVDLGLQSGEWASSSVTSILDVVPNMPGPHGWQQAQPRGCGGRRPSRPETAAFVRMRTCAPSGSPHLYGCGVPRSPDLRNRGIAIRHGRLGELAWAPCSGPRYEGGGP
jgi:hypothetical protein